jgi:hypothetical protein
MMNEINTAALPGWVFLLAFVILTDVLFLIFIWPRFKRKAALQKLAKETGLHVLFEEKTSPGVLDKFFPEITELKSEPPQRPYRIDQEMRFEGGRRTHYLIHEAETTLPSEIRFILHPAKNANEALLKMGMPVALSGDEAFDHAIVFKTRQPERVHYWLLPEIRQLLMTAFDEKAAKGWIKLDQGKLLYKEVGTLSSSRKVPAQTALFKALMALADALEVSENS